MKHCIRCSERISVLNLDSFFPQEMTTAPEHPLAANRDLPISGQSASKEKIRQIQQRDRIPGVVKRIVSLDANTFWEYWWCVPGRILLPEDIELLRSDRLRVESILSKLVWLFGGYCFGDDTPQQGEQKPVYDWQQIIEFARQHGFESYVLDIDFLPSAIQLDNRNSQLTENTPSNTHVAVEPAHWHIEFFRLQPAEAEFFEIQEVKNLCSCQIWTGKPFLKNLETGEAVTRYDLWVSYPGHITNTPWMQ